MKAKEILQKELDINKQMQKALGLRITAIRDTKGPQMAIFFSQSYKDQIELDELRIRELELIKFIENAKD